MNKMQIKKIVKENLGKHLNCEQEIFDHNGLIFHKPIKLNEFQQNPFLEITSIEKTIIVSASDEIMGNVKTLLVGKSRDEVFECPLIYGQSIYYVRKLSIILSHKFIFF